MRYFISFGLCGFSSKLTFLYGNHNIPIKILNLGLISIMKFKFGETSDNDLIYQFTEFINKSTDTNKFITERLPELIKYKENFELKTFEKFEKRYEGIYNYQTAKINDLIREIDHQSNEISKLKQTIRMFNEVKEELDNLEENNDIIWNG